jgi:hypothetical protein
LFNVYRGVDELVDGDIVADEGEGEGEGEGETETNRRISSSRSSEKTLSTSPSEASKTTRHPRSREALSVFVPTPGVREVSCEKGLTDIIFLNFDHESLSVFPRSILRVCPRLEREIETVLLFLGPEDVVVVANDATVTISEVCEVEFIVSEYGE